MTRSNQLATVSSLTFILISIMLISRPFLGIKHDGIFYFLQSLKIKHPNIYNHDIFFLNGSQDQYTIFTNVYSYLITITNASIASAILELTGLLLWVAALFFLARSILPYLFSILTVGLVITLDSYYGSHQVLSYAESYLTARLYAELLSLMAIGLFLRKRYIFGSMILMFSLTFHPLITIPAILISISFAISIRNWVIFYLVTMMLGIFLGILQLPPFNGLVETMSKDWYDYNILRSPWVFLHTWDIKGFSQLLYVISASCYVYINSHDLILKKLSTAILIVTIFIFTTEFIGGSILKIPLIIALQLHRILWIDLILVPFLLISLAWIKYTLGLKKESLVAILLLSILLLDYELHGIICTLTIITTLLIKLKKPELLKTKIARNIIILCISIPIFFSFLEIKTSINTFQYISDKTNTFILITNPIFTTALFVIAYFLLSLEKRFIYLIIHILSFSFLITTLLYWYNKDLIYFQEASETFYDSKARQEAIAPIRAIIPEDKTVYWVDSPKKSWFWLKRANYVSMEQGAGSVFSEANTLELMRRAERVKRVSLIDSESNWSTYQKYKAHRPKTEIINQASLNYLCEDKILKFILAEQERFEVDISLKLFFDPINKTKYGVYQCL